MVRRSRCRRALTTQCTRAALATTASLLLAGVGSAQPVQARRYPLASADGLQLHNVTAESVTHAGKRGVRPTNGRADDQERRNHAAPYIAHPDWHGQPQPTLIVHDVKSGARGRGRGRGAVALWIDAGTVAHFRDLRVSR